MMCQVRFRQQLGMSATRPAAEFARDHRERRAAVRDRGEGVHEGPADRQRGHQRPGSGPRRRPRNQRPADRRAGRRSRLRDHPHRRRCRSSSMMRTWDASLTRVGCRNRCPSDWRPNIRTRRTRESTQASRRQARGIKGQPTGARNQRPADRRAESKAGRQARGIAGRPAAVSDKGQSVSATDGYALWCGTAGGMP